MKIIDNVMDISSIKEEIKNKIFGVNIVSYEYNEIDKILGKTCDDFVKFIAFESITLFENLKN